MPRSLTDELTYHLTLNGMLKMQSAILDWAKLHQKALNDAGLIPSFIETMREEIQLHEASAETRQVLEKASQ